MTVFAVLLFILFLPFVVTLAHYVGDYLLQSPDMAKTKKTNIRVAVKHCLIYTACHIPVVVIYSLGMVHLSLLGITIIFLSHLLQDYYEWPLKTYMNRARDSGPWAPVLYVAFDNVYHWLTNYAILALCLILAILV